MSQYLFQYPYLKLVTGTRNNILLNHLNGELWSFDEKFKEIMFDIDKYDVLKLVNKYGTNLVMEFQDVFLNENYGILVIEEIKNQLAQQPTIKEKSQSIEIAEIEMSDFLLQHYEQIINVLRKLGCHTFFFLLQNDNCNLSTFYKILNKVKFSFNLVILENEGLTLTDENLKDIHKVENLFWAYFKAWNNPIEIEEFSKKFKQMDDYNKIQVTEKIYTASKTKHPYFSGRIFIDHNGNFSNCYKDKPSVAPLLQSPIDHIIPLLKQQKFWNIKRTSIIGCKDCEFRFSCLDNSPLIKQGEEYRMVEDCTFSPIETTT